MLLKVPFFKSKGKDNQCMQIAMQTVLKHFLDKNIGLRRLDNLTGRKRGKWTWTSQIVHVLYDFGLDLKYYSKMDLEPFLKGESFIRKHFGKDSGKILKYTDFEALEDSIKKLRRYGLFEKKKISFNKIESHIDKRHVPLVLLDYNQLEGENGLYQGHFVVMTGYDKKYAFYHESGPENIGANRKVSKEKFIQAWDANGTDNDVVIVFGKRTK